ncbi:MAG: hypothetical protein ACREOO_07105 [bacterium]
MLEGTSEVENTRIVYQQACENMRYQDDLRWSRFKTISIIEGAFLLALYQFQLKPIESLVIAVFGSVLVLIVSLMTLKDTNDSFVYYLYANELQKMMGIQTLSFKPVLGKVRGKHLMIFALAVINLFNILVLTKFWSLLIDHYR